jgi:hypothetical protein
LFFLIDLIDSMETFINNRFQLRLTVYILD